MKHQLINWGYMEPQTILQRYMNLPKFMYLLQESALFLPKISKFEDHLEGGLTAKDFIIRSNDAAMIDIAINSLWPAVNETPENRRIRLEQVEPMKRTLEARTFETPFGSYRCNDIDKLFSRCREWIYVSCWHKSHHECSAMWSLYGAENNSVCIFTTEEKLRDQIQQEDGTNTILLQDVTYLDHQSSILDKDSLAPFTSKALPFCFEKELRIVSYNPNTDLNIATNNSASGQKLLIRSLSQLIDKILVSPKADPWFVSSIQQLCSAYKLYIEVSESSLRTKRVERFYDAAEQLSFENI